jgi:hypothetical protein
VHESAFGTSVWTGRASQAGYDDLEIIGLAHLYSALKGAFCSRPSWISVWTGRASQAGYDDLEIIGLAHLYSALKGAFAPGHHGYPRTSDLIRVKALEGR